MTRVGEDRPGKVLLPAQQKPAQKDESARERKAA